MKNKLKWMMAVGMLSCSVAMAQQQSDIMSVSASTNVENAALAFDKNMKTKVERSSLRIINRPSAILGENTPMDMAIKLRIGIWVAIAASI